MKQILVLFIVLLSAYTVHAEPVDKIALENAMSEQFGASVKVLTVRMTFNPLDNFINIFDNTKIRRIMFTIDKKHFVRCDITVYENPRRARLEYCQSRTYDITKGYVYF